MTRDCNSTEITSIICNQSATLSAYHNELSLATLT